MMTMMTMTIMMMMIIVFEKIIFDVAGCVLLSKASVCSQAGDN